MVRTELQKPARLGSGQIGPIVAQGPSRPSQPSCAASRESLSPRHLQPRQCKKEENAPTRKLTLAHPNAVSSRLAWASSLLTVNLTQTQKDHEYRTIARLEAVLNPYPRPIDAKQASPARPPLESEDSVRSKNCRKPQTARHDNTVRKRAIDSETPAAPALDGRRAGYNGDGSGGNTDITSCPMPCPRKITTQSRKERLPPQAS